MIGISLRRWRSKRYSTKEMEKKMVLTGSGTGDAFKKLHGVGVLAGWLFDKKDVQIDFTL